MKKLLYSIFIIVFCISFQSEAVSFRIIAIPDTQGYSMSYPSIFNGQTQWVVDNVDNLDIAFVTHLGDLVNNPNTTQWNRADTAMDILDGHVPYSACIGNHDVDDPARLEKSLGFSWYLNRFGPSRYSSYSWYGGSCSIGTNHYQIFTAGGITFLHLNMEVEPSDAALSWAQGILDQHPELPAIYSTHAFLHSNGTLDTTPDMSGFPPSSYNPGSQQWNKLVKYNNQIFMVLNGHYAADVGEARITAQNSFGNDVFVMCSDYQSYDYGGNGYLRILEFDIPNDCIYVKTYSTELDEFLVRDSSQFTLNIDFDSRFDFAMEFEGGDGSPNSPYQISNSQQLGYVNADLSANYILVNNVNLGSNIYTSAVIAFTGESFTGSFNGNGFSISYLTIEGDHDYVGLFGSIGSGGSVTNLGIKNANISGGQRVGVLAACANDITITNCYATGAITAGSYTGGLVGELIGGSVTDSYAAVNITSGYHSGGFAGSATAGTQISNSHATGLVTGVMTTVAASRVGGFVGNLGYACVIDDCYATGNVVGGLYVGGFVGAMMVNPGSHISNSYATGSVTSDHGTKQRIGGFVGNFETGASNSNVIDNCYADGAVVGGTWVGGFAGNNSLGMITNSYATGSVYGSLSTGRVGGFTGANWSSTTYTNNYSTGLVTSASTTSIGGFIGHVGNTSINITKCFWDKETSGKNNGFGNVSDNSELIGLMTAEMKTRSNFVAAGWNYATIWAQCESNYPILRWQSIYDLLADFDGDCVVNMFDLDIMAENWLQTGLGIVGDIVDDDIINFNDFTILAAEWVEQ